MRECGLSLTMYLMNRASNNLLFVHKDVMTVEDDHHLKSLLACHFFERETGSRLYG